MIVLQGYCVRAKAEEKIKAKSIAKANAKVKDKIDEIFLRNVCDVCIKSHVYLHLLGIDLS